MPGFVNTTNITQDNLTYIFNSSSMPEIIVRASWTIYDGWLYFILLCILFVAIIIKAQSVQDQLEINIMDAATIVSVLALVIRLIEVTISGSLYPLITDFQMWIFPLIAVSFALYNWLTKK
jgi:hypothetical protein